MKSSVRLKTAVPSFLIGLALVSFGRLPGVQAITPAPDGCYARFTTAEGCDALNSLTTGAGNTGLGWRSLFSNSTGNSNTAVGGGALVLNNADSNTAVGAAALLLNTTGTENTAIGTDALVFNDMGIRNTAVGAFALFNNTAGGNTAIGSNALLNNTTGGALENIQGLDVGPNVAVGSEALESNTVASANTAVGYQALHSFTTGPVGIEQLGLCTAVGFQALANTTTGRSNSGFGYQALFSNTTGTGNVAMGRGAGFDATTGNGNVYIGAGVAGLPGESDHTYIRNINNTTVSGGGTDTVTVNLFTGLLGHLSSSRRYKEDIQPMDVASETLYRLNPVTFRYKKEIDPGQSLDYGLVAEEVAKVDPNLANRNREGQIESVRYNAINAMLLNEFLKEHRKVEEQQASIAKLKEELETIVARLKQQDAKIEKVNAQVKLSRPAQQMVTNQP